MVSEHGATNRGKVQPPQRRRHDRRAAARALCGRRRHGRPQRRRSRFGARAGSSKLSWQGPARTRAHLAVRARDTSTTTANRLRTAVKLANRRVFARARAGISTQVWARPLPSSSTTDRVRDLWSGRQSHLSRSCRRDRAPDPDHTWVETLLRRTPRSIGALREPSHAPRAHEVIGGQDDVEVTITSRQLVAGDRFVICSDGVHGPLAEDRIAQIVRSAPDTKRRPTAGPAALRR